jgi:hypothetical protein
MVPRPDFSPVGPGGAWIQTRNKMKLESEASKLTQLVSAVADYNATYCESAEYHDGRLTVRNLNLQVQILKNGSFTFRQHFDPILPTSADLSEVLKYVCATTAGNGKLVYVKSVFQDYPVCGIDGKALGHIFDLLSETVAGLMRLAYR